MYRDTIIQFFEYAHLPEHLQAVSKPFCELAKWMTETLPSNPERSAAMRSLLQAKDAAIRALLFKMPDLDAVREECQSSEPAPFSKPFTEARSGMGIPKR